MKWTDFRYLLATPWLSFGCFSAVFLLPHGYLVATSLLPIGYLKHYLKGSKEVAKIRFKYRSKPVMV